jgi:hypothetical protein
MFAAVALRLGMRDPMLACFDLTQLQFRNRREVDPRLKRRRFERINGKLTAEIGQCV